jgi:hypothetical protein
LSAFANQSFRRLTNRVVGSFTRTRLVPLAIDLNGA